VAGSTGAAGATGPIGCYVPPGSAVTSTLSLSAPRNGTYFEVGERLQVTVTLADVCGNPAPATPATFSRLRLYAYGPKTPEYTKTAPFLNATTTNYLDLLSPKYGVNGQSALTVAPGRFTYQTAPIGQDVAGIYTVAAALKRDLVAGSGDGLDQEFLMKTLQVGAQAAFVGPEDDPVGAGAANSCLACHQNSVGGFVKMAHSVPGATGNGDFARDLYPFDSCLACHNNSSTSKNPIIRKVHGIHRGGKLLKPGAATDYGFGQFPAWGADATLADYAYATSSVIFPSLPGREKDCKACHATDTWKTKPSRAACGSCHDNLNFTAGVLSPPRLYSSACVLDADCKKTLDSGATIQGTCNATTLRCDNLCAQDADCGAAGYHNGQNVVCASDASLQYTKICVRKQHAIQTDDRICKDCHVPQGLGLSPIAERHSVTANPGTSGKPANTKYKLAQVAVGGAAAGGVFQVGDVPTVSFLLVAVSGTLPVTDLKDNASWSARLFLSGPSGNPQRLFGAAGYLNVKPAASASSTDGTLAFSTSTNTYTYTFPASGWPAAAKLPFNNDDSAADPSSILVAPALQPGTYDLWMTVYFSDVSVDPSTSLKTSFREVADSGIIGLRFGSAGKVQTRQVVTTQACNACHKVLQAHGGARQTAEGCSSCHTFGAHDAIKGQSGASCDTANANQDCAGGVGGRGWEACVPANSVSGAGKCTVTTDPTPGATIDFTQMVHNLHFGRLRGGYFESGRLNFRNAGNPSNTTVPGCSPYSPASCPPTKYAIYGGGGSLQDFSAALLSTDARACTKCHADPVPAVACTTGADCGYGLSCANKVCTNTSWQAASRRACLTCHDTGPAYAHAAVNAPLLPDGNTVESCSVCHGPDAAYSVESLHNITNPYRPPYARTPAE
jgi:OmcA/MtrC family decaheme c-type cytochrome